MLETRSLSLTKFTEPGSVDFLDVGKGLVLSSFPSRLPFLLFSGARTQGLAHASP